MPSGAMRSLNLSSTKRALLEALLEREGATPTTTTAPSTIQPRPVDACPPLSFAQQRLWFLEELEPGSGLYNVPCAARLHGSLDHAALERSLNMLVARHESLRTTFAAHAGKPFQIVAESRVLPLEVEDVRQLPPEERERRVREIGEIEARAPFDLIQGPLVRARLVWLDTHEHVLILSFHHIIVDGWSIGVLLRELAQLYAAARIGQPDPLEPLALQYPDYAIWQRQHVAGELLEGQLAYWRERLAGMPASLELPTDRARPAQPTYRGGTVSLELGKDLAERLQALAEANDATLYMVLLAGYQSLLSRYTGQLDVCVGTPVANRDRVELEGMVGFFANTLVLRTDLAGAPTFLELLRRVKDTCLGAYAHQDVPFERLVDELRPDRNAGQPPLIQTAFTLDRTDASVASFGEVRAELLDGGSRTSKFDLTLGIDQRHHGGLRATAEYSTDLFDAATVARLLDHYASILHQVVDEPRRRVRDLDILTARERQQVLVDWNQTTSDAPREVSVHTLVALQAVRTPAAVAVADANARITYADMNQRANRLAHHLQRLGVGPESRVGVCLERSAETIVVLLGIVKAGAAYVPLDPTYPEDRLRYMLMDADVRVLITRRHLADRVPSTGARVILLDDPEQQALLRIASTDEPVNQATPDNLVNIIYTSGSTGTPKGTALSHRGMVRLIAWHHRAFHVTPSDRAPHLASLSFDAAGWEIWPYLAIGASVHVPDEDTRLDAARLRDWLLAGGITIAFTTTAMAEVLLGLDWPTACSLRLLLTGGDALHRYPTPELPFAVINNYGPTECSVISTSGQVAVCQPGSDPRQTPSIGRPIGDTTVYVLDARLQPLPIGVAGELFIGGPGLARGYVNRPDLTAERFVPDRFGATPGARLYRSGDLVRWRPDGTLEFVGRLDHQVKIRGFRIELGEIEAALTRHPAIREVVVVARPVSPTDKRLVAYVVGREGTEPPRPAELREHLRQLVPDYMLPSTFVCLDALPLSPNGKVDHRALPDPRFESRADRQPYVAPRSQVEQVLAEIWSDMLDLPLGRIGIHDNFFELGGDSILSIRVVARATQAGLRLTPRQLFQHQTIAAVAELAEVAEPATEVPALQDAAPDQPVPLTAIQAWFFEQEFPGAHHWNTAYLLEAVGPVRPELVKRAIGCVIEHHAALRSRFHRTDRGWTQTFPPAATDTEVPFESVDLSAAAPDEQDAVMQSLAREAQSSLDLEQGPVLRVVHLDLGAERAARLLIVIHHLVVDAISWRLLMEDMHTAYRQLLAGQPVRLQRATTSFGAWAERVARYAQSPELLEQAAWWSALADAPAGQLPVDRLGGANLEDSARALSVGLNVERTRELLYELPARLGTRINDVLLTALARAMRDWTGSADLLVDLEGHGREPLFDDVDLSRTVGWFSSIYPALIVAAPHQDARYAIQATQRQLLDIPANGIGYGLLRYVCQDPDVRRRMRAVPRPEVSFNYLGRNQPGARDALAFDVCADERGAIAGPFRGSLHGSGQVRDHLIDVVGAVVDERIQFQWLYSQNVHDHATILAVAQSFVRTLSELIDQAQE